MTSVNVTTTKNTVTVNEGDTTIVTVATQGPPGILGQGLTGLSTSSNPSAEPYCPNLTAHSS